MPEACYIGIDTSNYTTSVAVVNAAGEVVANLKAPLPVAAGARGLRQSDAVFAHTKNLPTLLDSLGEVLKGLTPAAVCVSARPRPDAASYMPCFLSGIVAAKAIAAARDIPLFTTSHQEGHLMAALYSSGAFHALQGKRFGGFHVSGGTTEMLLAEPAGTAFSVTLTGGTADLHAGQVVDRIGVMMGLAFPCGRALEALARENTKKIPTPRISAREGICNLSGLENLAAALYRDTGDAPLVAAFVLRFIEDTLFAMATHLRAQYPALPLLFAGGVMSNRIIAASLTARLGEGVYFAEPAFSADNAAGVALIGRAKALGETL